MSPIWVTRQRRATSSGMPRASTPRTSWTPWAASSRIRPCPTSPPAPVTRTTGLRATLRLSESSIAGRGALSSAMTPIAGSLTPFLDPVSVAVIGASRDPFKVGGAVVANLRSAGFPGRIIPINSRASTVQGLAAAPRLADVEGRVDLAVIAVPAVDVLPALGQCVTKGVGGAVVISAGFRELGGEGARREARLREWLRDQPI